MINYIKGELVYIAADFAIIENNGIGYRVYMSPSTAAALGSTGSEVTVYTYMAVKEDDISLFGFRNAEELDMFNELLSVGGVGPKSALALLGSATPAQLSLAILTDDYATLSNAPNIGKKTAQRIALELKDRFKNRDIASAQTETAVASASAKTGARDDAIAGLLAWGYSSAEAKKAVNAVYEERLDAAQIISRALRVISK